MLDRIRDVRMLDRIRDVRMLDRINVRVLLSGLCLLIFSPGAVLAQPVSLGSAMGHTGEGGPLEKGFTLFLAMDVGYTPLKATYKAGQDDLASKNMFGVNTSLEETFTYKERSQRLLQLGPQFGVRVPLPLNITLSGAIGVTYMKLMERADVPVPGSEYNDNHHDYYTYDPNPGFSAMLGINWEALRFERLSIVTGLQLQYLSTYGLDGHTVEGKRDETVGGIPTKIEYDEVTTTDIALRMINIIPHLGLEWRPFSSFVVNSFGMFMSFMVPAGSSMTKEFKRHHKVAGAMTVEESLESKIGLSLSPIQMLGAYYAWYFAIPHFGTLGIELQFGSRWNAMLSYQYSF